MNSDGSGQTELASGFPAQAPWSPDGTKLLYTVTSADGLQTSLYVMQADGTGQMPLIGNGNRLLDVAWSPDGQRIAFTDYGTDSGVHEIFVIDADASGRDNPATATGAPTPCHCSRSA